MELNPRPQSRRSLPLPFNERPSPCPYPRDLAERSLRGGRIGLDQSIVALHHDARILVPTTWLFAKRGGEIASVHLVVALGDKVVCEGRIPNHGVRVNGYDSRHQQSPLSAGHRACLAGSLLLSVRCQLPVCQSPLLAV